MRFNFDLNETKAEQGRHATPKDEEEWVPLLNHPVFTSANSGTSADEFPTIPEGKSNLLAWDGASRLYFWDSHKRCLHSISIRLGEPEPTYVLAASPSKVLLADVQLNFEVQKISINGNGSALFLAGSDALYIMYLYGRASSKYNVLICRTVCVGSEIYIGGSSGIRVLQISWHPYSDTHLIQFSDFLICLRISLNWSKSIICSQWNLVNARMLHQFVMLIFHLVVTTYGTGLVYLFCSVMVQFISFALLFLLEVYTNGNL